MRWNVRSLAEEPIVRLILDGTVVRVRLDRKATSISLLVVPAGVHADGQKVLLAIKSMGGESAKAWRTVLDDLIRRGLRRPEFLIVDGAPGLDKAIAAVWDGVPVQRCTVHKHRNLLGACAEHLHRRDHSGLQRHDLCGHAGGDRDPSQGLHPQVAPQAPPCCRQSGGSRRTLVRLYPAAAEPMAQRAHHECDRAIARKSSNEGSKRRLSCRPRTPLQCCSGHCFPPAKIDMRKVRSLANTSPQYPSLSQLTSQLN